MGVSARACVCTCNGYTLALSQNDASYDHGYQIFTISSAKNSATRFPRNSTAITLTEGVKCRGVDPYGTGGDTSPQYLDWGDIITNVPLNISRVISATFYPCNIFLMS